MFENPWQVLHVASNHEKRVVQHLNAHAVENYLPLYTEKSRWTDRTVQLERPLFAGYVFTRFVPQQRLSVVSIPGVLHLLSGNGCHTVTDEELDHIRLGLSNGYLLRPHPWLEIGTNVRVLGGIFDGVRGVVTELRHQCKVIIALSAVQQCFSLEIPMDQLEVTDLPSRPLSARPSARVLH